MANSKITTTDLDFDGIKSSLKTYLRGQTRFSDYDFEGSALSILIDILAYNTHMGALYTNLAINEAFLDSASKRDSVVSKAKELGYTPTSAKSARAIVNINLRWTGQLIDLPSVLTIPRYTKFTTTVDSSAYTFYTLDTYSVSQPENGTVYSFTGVELVEGTLLDFSFTADGNTNSFEIPNADVDLTTLKVVVQEQAEASTYDTFLNSSTVLDLDGNSLVYFIKEVSGGKHKIEFGNGVLGKALDAGNIVTVTYMVTNADAANTARSFAYGDTLSNNVAVQTILTTVPAANGAPAESIDDIKWNAPRAFVAQNRCVTVEDFKTVVNSTYPNAASVNVWGGESNNPPTYGNVYIAIKPDDSERLSETEKNYLLNTIIKPRCTLTIHPIIVDVDYLYVDLKTSFYYDDRATTKTSGELEQVVREAIVGYNDTKLAKFGAVLKSSVLARYIDNADPSINSSVTTMTLRYKVLPKFGKTISYTVDLGNPIYNSGVGEQSVRSNGITLLNTNRGTVYFEDRPRGDGSTMGDLVLFAKVQSRKEYLPGTGDIKTARSYGTIDYESGKIVTEPITIVGLAESTFSFYIKPQSDDVAAAKNRIVTINLDANAVTAKLDKPADDYDFTSGRN